ncbi:MAG: ATP-binding protein [Thermoleophilia bacterium]|nr:ATP-binding protein [Thermoleophilia bacterium]
MGHRAVAGLKLRGRFCGLVERARLRASPLGNADHGDSGYGLDPGQCDPPREPEVLRLRGRGLYLMAKLTDEFEISIDGGTEIRMLKRLVDGGDRGDPSAGD